MAFPSDTGSATEDLAAAWARARSIAASIKLRTQSIRDQSLLNTLNSTQILDYSTFLADMRLALAAVAALGAPLAAYAQAQLNDNAINISTEFSNMVSAVDGVAQWIVTNFPKTPGTNELRAKVFLGDNSGRTVDVVFSSASLGPFRTALDALLGTIN